MTDQQLPVTWMTDDASVHSALVDIIAGHDPTVPAGSVTALAWALTAGMRKARLTFLTLPEVPEGFDACIWWHLHPLAAP